MNKLIITADDYGMSVSVNEAIDAGISASIITSTNVMTNMPHYTEASKLKELPDISVGIHWTLSCGKPVLSPQEIPTLVNQQGEFYKYPDFRKRYRKKLIKDDDIKKELIAQYSLFEEVYGEADYWNTHQNVHVDFRIYKLFVEVAKHLGIDKMRSHQRIYVPESANDARQPLLWRLIEPFKSRLLNNWQCNAHKQGIKSPDGLIVCLNNSDVNKLEYTFSHICWGKNKIGEYVIHPATKCDSPYFGKIVDQRIKEFEMFSDKRTLEIFKNNNIQLIDYKKI